MRRLVSLAALLALGAAPANDGAARLVTAKREALAASARAAALEREAAREDDAAAKARTEERAVAARVAAAAANVRAAEARVALVAERQRGERERLAAGQAPATRLLGALAALARRPPVAAVAQPGSIDDLVHLRAMLGTALPMVEERTRAVRAALAEARRLQAQASLAARALADGRAGLERERVALAALAARHGDRAAMLGRSALGEADRALALGERARDLVDQMAEAGRADATVTSLAALPGPLPRPRAPGAETPIQPSGAYRLPVAGRLVTGLGEVSDAGVRSRGLTFAVAAGATVRAPAGGVVRYAARFRGYGTVVILDHGAGWTTLMTGLGAVRATPGATVVAGAVIGTAGRGEVPQVTVELRRAGRPQDIAALIG